MATVDLDALAAALRAAGCETKRWDDDEYPSYLAVNLPVSDNPRRSIEWDVMDDGDVILYDDIQFGDKAFQSVDIIRRAVSPSAPEGLRERIAKAAYSAWWEHEKSPEPWGHVADAVLAVLPTAPRVDEVTIPRELAERLMEYADAVADINAAHDDHIASNEANADASRVLAMLEGAA